MIRIITDSSICCKKADADALGLKIVPICYTINGQVYFETYSDHNGEFEDILKRNFKFSTSQPSVSAFLSVFEEELLEGNEVLCVTISSRLSGTYSGAHAAAKQTQSKQIAIFDSQLAAGGLYLLVKEAKRLIDGGMGLSDIVKKLPEIRDRIAVAFSVEDLTPLRNSGRIGFVRMSVSTILNIRPILLCKGGAIVFDSIARGKADIVEKLANRLTASVKEVVINYIGSSRIATDLYNVIEGRFPNAAMSLQKVGPILGIHLGLQAAGVSFIAGES